MQQKAKKNLHECTWRIEKKSVNYTRERIRETTAEKKKMQKKKNLPGIQGRKKKKKKRLA